MDNIKRVYLQQKIKIIIIGILIIGIVVIGGLWILRKQPFSEESEPAFPRGFVIAHQNGLTNFSYDHSKQKHEKRTEIVLPGITGIVSDDNYFFIATKNREILRLNNKFEKTISKKFEEISAIASKKFEEISAIATDKKNIFISTEGSFIALDKDLNELSRVKFYLRDYPFPLPKNVHDILIYKTTAYLLDNEMLPLFLFRVNIEDPKNIQITEKIKIFHINPHLEAQWLNPKLNQWLIFLSYSHMGGGGKIVHIYPMDKGKEEWARQEIFRSSFFPKEEKRGFNIQGITDIPPIWAVIQDVEGKYHLTQVKSENNEISFSNVLDLDKIYQNQKNPLYGDGERKSIIKYRSNYLFIIPKYKSLLTVIDTRSQSKIVLLEDLSKFGIEGIIDILPY